MATLKKSATLATLFEISSIFSAVQYPGSALPPLSGVCWEVGTWVRNFQASQVILGGIWCSGKIKQNKIISIIKNPFAKQAHAKNSPEKKALVVHLSFCKILRKETQIHISCLQYLLLFFFFFYCDAAESQPFCKQHVKITCDARESRFSLQFCTLGSSKVGIIPFLEHNRIAIEELPGNIVKAERYAFSTQALSHMHMTSLGSKTAQWVWHPSQCYFLFAYKKKNVSQD